MLGVYRLRLGDLVMKFWPNAGISVELSEVHVQVSFPPSLHDAVYKKADVARAALTFAGWMFYEVE